MIHDPANPYAAPDFQGPMGPGPNATTSGAAIASVILGALSFVFLFLTGIPAIILGIIAQGAIGKSRGQLKGTGQATAGIVMGSIGTLMFPCIGVLIALLLPAVQSAREAARRAQCTNNLKQISLALYNYESTYGSFPPPYTTDAAGKPLLSWRVLILPYMEEMALYEQIEMDEPWDSPANQTLLSRMPAVYKCPSSLGPAVGGLTNYQVLVGPGTIFEAGQLTKMADITDGVSSTLLVAESNTPVEWMKPDDIAYTPGLPLNLGSTHTGGFNAAMADGAVRFIRSTVAPAVLDGLAVKNDGKQPGAF
jgi:prepilin-type processing-associated H-X9-DG protein